MSAPVQVETHREMRAAGVTIGCAASIGQAIDRSTQSGVSTGGARVAA